MDQPDFTIRPEGAQDLPAIRRLTTDAFRAAPHASGTEAAISDALREAGALTLSLVAVEGGSIVGHVAFSPVTIDGSSGPWHGLGPVSVRPDRQRAGIGRALIEEGLARLRRQGTQVCVVLGDPAYYGRFGFRSDPGLRYGDVPPEYFQRLVISGPPPAGEVAYHPAFGVA
ncbi:MAG: N-acetyltransferase [Rhizobiaceae bacterium]|nr:N-acetyltransferase [Rhizobiaceae bacterium]MCV0408012.1 N-acetyltransferase [Rhizobiaceae bacterium]